MSRLTPGQAELLVEVYRHPGRGPAEHSRAMGNDPAWTNKLIRALERLGLAERYTSRRCPAGSRTLRPIRPLHKALLVRHGRVVAFGDDGRRHRFLISAWAPKALAGARLLGSHSALVLYRDPPSPPALPPNEEQLCADWERVLPTLRDDEA